MNDSEKLVIVKCCPGDPGDGFLYSFVVAPTAMDMKIAFALWLADMDSLHNFEAFSVWLTKHGCRRLMPDEVVEVWSDEGMEQFNANH